jgi:hypothetical protein
MKFSLRIFLIVAIFFYGLNFSFCQNSNYYSVSQDTKILNSLKVFERTGNEEALNIIRRKDNNLKIIFYDLGLLSFDYASHYAVATSDGQGTDYILINSRFDDEPDEAIASIIAHELTHQLSQTTMEEEIRAWTNETKQWIYCKKNNPKLAALDEKKYPMVRRLNYLETLYREGNSSNRLIAEVVEHNSTYNKLALK